VGSKKNPPRVPRQPIHVGPRQENSAAVGGSTTGQSIWQNISTPAWSARTRQHRGRSHRAHIVSRLFGLAPRTIQLRRSGHAAPFPVPSRQRGARKSPKPRPTGPTPRRPTVCAAEPFRRLVLCRRHQPTPFLSAPCVIRRMCVVEGLSSVGARRMSEQPGFERSGVMVGAPASSPSKPRGPASQPEW